MATSVEGNSSGKDLRGLSSLDDSNLEKSILRRGLATAGEIEACKNHRSKVAAEDKLSSPSLLEVMVGAKVLTRSQMIRLLQEKGEGTRKLEIPGYQIMERLGRARWGPSTRRSRSASIGSWPSRYCSIPWPRTRSSSSDSSARPRSPPSFPTTTWSTPSMPERRAGVSSS